MSPDDLGAWIARNERAIRADIARHTDAVPRRVNVAGRTTRVHVAGSRRAIAAILRTVPGAEVDGWTDQCPAACTIPWTPVD